ncbi:MAG: hypothetical protein EXS17_04360 [Phycisphaerales bacterium]|nr:hypothetical protein [Phycisphaerales bacterium]
MKFEKSTFAVAVLCLSITASISQAQSEPASGDNPPASEPIPTEPTPASENPAAASATEGASVPMLRAQARQAMSRSQWASAADLWSAVMAQVPGDAEAAKGLSDAQAALNQASSVDKVAGDDAVLREQAQVEFDSSLIRASELFTQGNFASANNTVVQAKVALQRNKSLFSPADYDNRMARAESEQVRIASAQTTSAEAQKVLASKDASQSATLQKQQLLEQRQRTINEDMTRIRQLQAELKYKEALEVVQEILFIDPTNPAALALRDTIESGILYRRYTEMQRQRSVAFQEFAVDAQAAFVPPKKNFSGPGPRSTDAVMSYPEDWPQISTRRGGAAGFTDSQTDQAALAKMREKINVDFAETEFEAAINYFKEVTGLDFYVDWKSLDAAGVTKQSTVSLAFPSIRADKALDMALESASGDSANPADSQANRADWAMEDGIVVVASTEALALRRVTIVYDVRDLLYLVPYFDNAPNFNIDAALNQGAQGGGGGGGGGGGTGGGGGFGGGGGGGSGGGGGGGGGGGSLFGSGTSLGIEDQREQILTRLKELIKFLVPEAFWDKADMTESRLDDFSGNLIVTATPKTHRDIMNLLSQLRAVRAIQINIESRLISVEVQWFEQIGIDFDLYFNSNPGMFDYAVDQDPNFQLRDFFFQRPPGPASNTGDPRVGRLKNPVVFQGLGQTLASGNSTSTGTAIAPPVPVGGAAGGGLVYGQSGPTNGGFYNPIGVRRNGDSYGGLYDSNGMSPIQVQQEGLPLIQLLGAGLKGTVAQAALANPALSVGFTYLDDVQVDLLVQATQADQRAMTLTAPRLTLFNGSRSWISFGASQAYVANVQAVTGDAAGAFQPNIQNLRTGFVLDIEAVTSADRRYVSMTVQFAQNILIKFDQQSVSGAAGGGDAFGRAGSFSATIQLPDVAVTQINTAVSVPDKGTILLGGRREVAETEIEVGVPVLSKVPFVNRFFTNSVTSKIETTTLLLIRPEVIIQQEAEDLLFPGLGDQLSGAGAGSR